MGRGWRRTSSTAGGLARWRSGYCRAEEALPRPRRGGHVSSDLSHGRAVAGPALRGLVGAAHIGPALAVTVLSGLLAAAQGLGPGRGALVVAAVLAGQLSVGWSNDLLDLDRDRRAGRTDKPLASGEVS